MNPGIFAWVRWLLMGAGFGVAAFLAGWATNKLRRGGMILLLTFMLGFASLISFGIGIVRFVKWIWMR